MGFELLWYVYTVCIHLGSNTLCNLTKKCIRAYAQKAAELKPKLAEFIEYRQRIIKKKVLATKPAIDNSIPGRFKTEYSWSNLQLCYG